MSGISETATSGREETASISPRIRERISYSDSLLLLDAVAVEIIVIKGNRIKTTLMIFRYAPRDCGNLVFTINKLIATYITSHIQVKIEMLKENPFCNIHRSTRFST